MQQEQRELPRFLRFKSVRRTALWGSEDWVVSAHPAGSSVIVSGPLAGKTLNDIWPDFPLLFKVIDAQSRLSVQVHPNEETCLMTGGEPKTEMWCLLNDGSIYAGLKPGVGAAEIEEAVKSGKFEELLVHHQAKAGDVFFIPGGLVHAIDSDTRLYEVQQSSDTTFRLYDWGRVGADGHPRQLHISESLKAINYGLPPVKATDGVICPFFAFQQLELKGEHILDTSAAFTVLYAARGTVKVADETLDEGESLLITPGESVRVVGENALLFVTTPTKG